MVKRNFIFLALIVLFFVGINSAHSVSGQVTSKVCNATSKVCVSNITNDLTVKDEELLQACKDCCSHSLDNAPSSVVGNVKGCIPRCQKSCETAYKKVVGKVN